MGRSTVAMWKLWEVLSPSKFNSLDLVPNVGILVLLAAMRVEQKHDEEKSVHHSLCQVALKRLLLCQQETPEQRSCQKDTAYGEHVEAVHDGVVVGRALPAPGGGVSRLPAQDILHLARAQKTVESVLAKFCMDGT